MPTTIHLPLLDTIRIASPCSERWETMCGDDRRRHCAKCNLDVHNISALSRDEAESVLAKLAEGRVCARFFRRTDGTILTKDCPIGLAAARANLLKSISRCAAALGLAVLSAAAAKAAQDKSWGNYGWAIRLTTSSPAEWVRQKLPAIRVAIGLPIAPPAGMWWSGDIGILPPPGHPPPASGINGTPYGPHELEHQQ